MLRITNEILWLFFICIADPGVSAKKQNEWINCVSMVLAPFDAARSKPTACVQSVGRKNARRQSAATRKRMDTTVRTGLQSVSTASTPAQHDTALGDRRHSLPSGLFHTGIVESATQMTCGVSSRNRSTIGTSMNVADAIMFGEHSNMAQAPNDVSFVHVDSRISSVTPVMSNPFSTFLSRESASETSQTSFAVTAVHDVSVVTSTDLSVVTESIVSIKGPSLTTENASPFTCLSDNVTNNRLSTQTCRKLETFHILNVVCKLHFHEYHISIVWVYFTVTVRIFLSSPVSVLLQYSSHIFQSDTGHSINVNINMHLEPF